MLWTPKPFHTLTVPLEHIRDIRLLRVEAGDGEIFCKLEHVPLFISPPFDALSYTWGRGHTDHDIICDDDTFPVRQNLYDALAELRFKDRPRLLWVNAVSHSKHPLVWTYQAGSLRLP
jgi:hypothetical protein